MGRNGLYHHPPHHAFLVVRLGAGRPEVMGTADGPGNAYSAVVRFRQQHPGAAVTWMLRPDWTGAVKAMGRLRRHALRNGRPVGERERTVHVFPLQPGQPVGDVVVAACRAALDVNDIEWLATYSGMPCELCVYRTVPNTVLPGRGTDHAGSLRQPGRYERDPRGGRRDTRWDGGGDQHRPQRGPTTP